MNGTRGILMLLSGLGLLVAGITIPRPCLAQILCSPTPVAVGFIYSPMPDPNYYLYKQPMPAPEGYYVMAPAPKPWKHGYKQRWGEYPHCKNKHKIKHKNKHKHHS